MTTQKEKKTLTWDDVLKRGDLIGGDIETIEDGVVYRGPLAMLQADDETIQFTSPWCAKNDGRGWETWDNTTSFVSKEVTPQDIGQGRIHFQMPFVGPCTLFPKGGSKLDPLKVKGLAPAWARLLARHPDMILDREKAKTVLKDRCFGHQVEALTKMPENSTLCDLLGKFLADSSREEFLWCYIEAMTGEKNVHYKVY